MKWLAYLSLFMLLLFVAFLVAINQPPKSGLTREQHWQREKFLSECEQVMDRFEPVTAPPTVPPEAADELLNPEELVIGVVVNEEARAYPLNLIDTPERKVINDTLGGEPILITWCDQCHTAAVFSRRINGQDELFACSGLLWKQTLVVYDMSTMSFWNHVMGKAVAGKRTGEQLQALDYSLTPWERWKTQYPETSVVQADRVSKVLNKDYYAGKIPLKHFIFGVRTLEGAEGWTFDLLAKSPVINTTVDGQPVVILFDRDNFSARMFSSLLGSKRLTFEQQGESVVDQETGTAWNILTGKAESGELAGQHLKPEVGVTSFHRHWQLFFPGAVVHETPQE